MQTLPKKKSSNYTYMLVNTNFNSFNSKLYFSIDLSNLFLILCFTIKKFMRNSETPNNVHHLNVYTS